MGNSFSKRGNRVVPVSGEGPVAEGYMSGIPRQYGTYVDSESDDDDMYGAGTTLNGTVVCDNYRHTKVLKVRGGNTPRGKPLASLTVMVGYNNQTAVCTAAAVRGTERSFPARAIVFVMSVV